MEDNRIAIVGAGQAGALLALTLRLNGYHVTLYNDKDTSDIINGRILSSQVTFDTAVQIEKTIGIKNLYDAAPENNNIHINIVNSGIQPFIAKTRNSYYSVDLRLKTVTYINLFIKNNGVFIVDKIDISKLNDIANENDLVIIASGKAPLNTIFLIDEEKTKFKQSLRNYCCIYVKNITQVDEHRGLRINMLPGLGEFFITPGLNKTGACEMLLFEAIHHSPLDFWKPNSSNEELLSLAIQTLRKYLPNEAERLTHAEITDPGATLIGSFRPSVRLPIAKLNNGKHVLGIADAIVLNDPIAGQGANTAIKATKIYFDSIRLVNNRNYNTTWMYNTFQKFWDNVGKHSTFLSNTLLMPESDKLMPLFYDASCNQELAIKLTECFDKPENFIKTYNDMGVTS